jgi:putative ABC transport system permease protein
MRRLHTLEEGISVAVDSVRANKLRSGLTILGVAIGVGVVVSIAALVTGIRSSILEGFEAAGPNNFGVMRFDFSSVRVSIGDHRPPWAGKPRIEPYEADRLDELPSVRDAFYNFDFTANLDVEGQQVRGIPGKAYEAGWPVYFIGQFVAGRDFTPEEVRQSRPLVVITEPLAEELFGALDPVGRKVRLSVGSRGVSERFEVVGVFLPDANVFSSFVKHMAIVPYTSAMKRLKASRWQANVWVVPHDSVPQSVAIDEVLGAMRGMRGLRPAEENNFAILRSDQMVEAFDDFTGVFFLIMLALSSVGLLVGGIGVVGIMMISVTERTREIGIRKAVGATRREILWQFLVESAALTVMGAVAGLALGALLAFTVAAYTPIPAEIPIWALITSIVMAIVTGMLFGLFPAYRASRLAPVAALRYE